MLTSIVRRFLRAMDFFTTAMLCLSVAGFSCLAMTQVICRYVFNNSLTWSDQACRYLFCITTFMGAAACVREQSHITIDILAEILPRRFLKHQGLIVNLFILGISILLAVTGWQLAMRNMGQDTTTLPVRMGVIYMMIPVASAIMAVNAVRVIYGKCVLIRSGADERAPEPSID